MKKYIVLAVVVLATLVPLNAYSWGEKGHSLVVQIAFNYLDPTTRKVLTEYHYEMKI